MADVVRLRNVSDQDRLLPLLRDQLVRADAVVEIPARLLHHQPQCPGIVKGPYDLATGSWPEGPCEGCLEWPEETWSVESDPSDRKAKG